MHCCATQLRRIVQCKRKMKGDKYSRSTSCFENYVILCHSVTVPQESSSFKHSNESSNFRVSQLYSRASANTTSWYLVNSPTPGTMASLSLPTLVRRFFRCFSRPSNPRGSRTRASVSSSGPMYGAIACLAWLVRGPHHFETV